MRAFFCIIFILSGLAGANSAVDCAHLQISDGEVENPWVAEYPKLDEAYSFVKERLPVSSEPAVSVVIPAYNEAKRLPASLHEIKRFLSRYDLPIEFIIWIEKSTDGTSEAIAPILAGDPRFRVESPDFKKGKGFAVRSGVQLARGDYVFFTDADLSTPIAEVIMFLKAFMDVPSVSVLIGSRKNAHSQIEVKQSVPRQVMSGTFNRMVRLMSGLQIEDTQCGFKAFTKDAAQRIFQLQESNGFAFDVEVLLLAQALNFNIQSIPVRWKDAAGSTVNPLTDPLKMLKDVMKMRRIVKRNVQRHPELIPVIR